jgi:hypothetical protein
MGPQQLRGVYHERALPGAAMRFLHPIESLMLPVLDFNPVLRPAGLIGPIAMLRDDPLSRNAPNMNGDENGIS